MPVRNESPGPQQATRVLAIETSCDESAVAVMDGPEHLIGSRVWSQAASHAPFGGVVPEMASRQHGEILPGLVHDMLASLNVPVESIDLVAATTSPGLPTALLVGAAYAKGMAIALGRPFLAINHVEGHLLSPFFAQSVVPPHVGLVVSGGHTLLVDVRGVGDYRILGTTLDDAAGEAFDKVAKLLGLGYPGGVEVDRQATTGDPSRYDFPRSMLRSGDFDFSFSGLKTAVRVLLDKFPDAPIPDVCASFQEAVVDVLVGKAIEAAKITSHRRIALSGGVSSNTRLQALIAEKSLAAGIQLHIAAPDLRTDNAAMIAYVAAQRHRLGEQSPLDTDVIPTFQRKKFEQTCGLDRHTA
jgi:N6-L-threonylcarbamoyladenine synthase